MSVEELKNKGNEAFKEGNYEEAVKHFSDAIDVDPNNHILYSNRSAAFVKLNQGEKALEDANKVVELKPDWSKGYGRKGAALHSLGKLEEAAAAYQQGLDLDPQNVQLRQGFQDCKVAKVPAENIGRLFGDVFKGDIITKIANHPETKIFLSQPDYLQKIKEIQEDPSKLQQYINDQRIMATFGMLAQSIFKGGQPAQESQETANSEPEREPEPEPKQKEEPKETPKPEPVQEEKEEPMEIDDDKKKAEEEKNLGNKAYKAKNFEEALKHYDAAIALDTTNIVFYTNKAAVYFEQKKYDECIDTCMKGIDEGRKGRYPFEAFAKAYFRVGNAYAKKDELDLAIEAYNKSLSEHRTADCLNALKKVEKIKEQREKEAYLDPQKALEAKERGNTLFREGNFPKAIEEYTEAIKRNPKDAVLYSNRAACYTKLGAFPEGLKDCEEALNLDPAFVKAYSRKGNLLFWMKEYQRAQNTFREGLKHDPQHAEMLQGIQRCQQALREQQQNLSEEERAQNALKDPEVAEIMSDPVMRQILDQMQTDPKAAQDHLRNPVVMQKIQKLIDAGIISVGSR